MISYSFAVEFSEGYFGDDDDHSSDEDYEPTNVVLIYQKDNTSWASYRMNTILKFIFLFLLRALSYQQ
jgi:hypothetical protein